MTGDDNSNLVLKAKIEWYREVLLLEPNSKIFLPFARHLAEMGSSTSDPCMLNEAFDVLRRGLLVHPDFMEARLFLIELLNACDCRSQCGAEVARLASLFLSYPDFWDAWREHAILENESADFSIALGFMSAILKDKSVSIVQILEAGLASLRSPLAKKLASNEVQNTVKTSSPVPEQTFESILPEESISPLSKDSMQQISSILKKTRTQVSAEQENAPEDAPGNSPTADVNTEMQTDADLDIHENSACSTTETVSEEADCEANFEAEEEDIDPLGNLVGEIHQEGSQDPHAEDDGLFLKTHRENYENYAQKHEADSRTTQETLAALLADTSIVVEPMDKSPFRTRSMAEVLSEQGDLHGAIEIYKELIAKASTDDADSLKNRLTELEADAGISPEDISGLLAIDDLVDTSFGTLAKEEQEQSALAPELALGLALGLDAVTHTQNDDQAPQDDLHKESSKSIVDAEDMAAAAAMASALGLDDSDFEEEFSVNGTDELSESSENINTNADLLDESQSESQNDLSGELETSQNMDEPQSDLQEDEIANLPEDIEENDGGGNVAQELEKVLAKYASIEDHSVRVDIATSESNPSFDIPISAGKPATEELPTDSSQIDDALEADLLENDTNDTQPSPELIQEPIDDGGNSPLPSAPTKSTDNVVDLLNKLATRLEAKASA